MLYPTPEELSKGKYNRYVLVSATAKCARMVTDEYCKCRENAERQIANKETERSIASMIRKEIRDEKAVKCAIRRLYSGEYSIVDSSIKLDDK